MKLCVILPNTHSVPFPQAVLTAVECPPLLSDLSPLAKTFLHLKTLLRCCILFEASLNTAEILITPLKLLLYLVYNTHSLIQPFGFFLSYYMLTIP